MGFLHAIGSFALFASMVLLIIASVGTPVRCQVLSSMPCARAFADHALHSTNQVLQNADYYHSTAADLSLGQWGICQASNCTSAKLGYDLSSIESMVHTDAILSGALESLTYAFLLNPLAAGFTAIAFLLSLGSCTAMGICASLLSLVASRVTIVAFAVDLAFAHLARNRLSADANVQGQIGKGVWFGLINECLQVLASVTVCWTRREGRQRRADREAPGSHEYDEKPPVAQYQHGCVFSLELAAGRQLPLRSTGLTGSVAFLLKMRKHLMQSTDSIIHSPWAITSLIIYLN